MRHLFLLSMLVLTVISYSQPAIVVLHGQPRKDAPETVGMDRQANLIKRILTEAGVKVADVKDDAITPDTFINAKIAVLPYNGPLPDACFEALKNFVEGGGKLMSFYNSDARVSTLLGLKAPKFIGGKDFGKPSGIKFSTKLLPGLPEKLTQSSWNVITVVPEDPNTKVLGEYVTSDGKKLGFNAVTMGPHGFAFAHILQREAVADTDRTMLTMFATAYPELWKEAAESAFTKIGLIDGCENYQALLTKLEMLPAGRHTETLEQTKAMHKKAREAYTRKAYQEAYQAAVETNTLARKAFMLSIPPRAAELRGAWIHSAYGILDWGWDKTIKALKDNGFNAIFVNMCWGYVADYESTVLPVHPNVAKRGDQIKLCLEACRKYGVELHVWKVCWNMGHYTPEPLKKQMRDAKRTQMTFKGNSSDFLAPHIKENLELEVRAFEEIAQKYAVDGIHFDYIRYPDSDCDYSASARAAFEKSAGLKVAKWPEDVGRQGKLRKRYNAWRQENISRAVEQASKAAHRVRPDIKISAAVYGGWDDAPNGVAQCAEKWIENGWLDFVCPMDYTPNLDYFRRLVQRNVEGMKRPIPLYIGIGSYQHRDAPMVAEQINLTRKLGADGFICFCHNSQFANVMLPELHQGPTAGNAAGPYSHNCPSYTVRQSKSTQPLLGTCYAFPEPVTVTFTMPKNYVFPPKTVVRLMKDGYYLQRHPNIGIAVNGNEITCQFIAPEPGCYRLDISDDKTVVVRSGNLRVLSPEETRQKLLEEGIPAFAKNGKPRVAVWQDEAYGSPAIMEAIKSCGLFDVAVIYNLKPTTLAACDAVVIPQPRKKAPLFKNADTAATLHTYIKNGGGLLVTHAMVGGRGYEVICPDIIKEAVEPSLGATQWKINANHAIAKGLPAEVQTSTFVDEIALVPASADQVVATEAKSGKPVILAGSCQKGRMVACGLGLGIYKGDTDGAMTATEAKLLVNAVNWLLAK